jgi:hypothetical protein
LEPLDVLPIIPCRTECKNVANDAVQYFPPMNIQDSPLRSSASITLRRSEPAEKQSLETAEAPCGLRALDQY